MKDPIDVIKEFVVAMSYSPDALHFSPTLARAYESATEYLKTGTLERGESLQIGGLKEELAAMKDRAEKAEAQLAEARKALVELDNLFKFQPSMTPMTRAIVDAARKEGAK